MKKAPMKRSVLLNFFLVLFWMSSPKMISEGSESQAPLVIGMELSYPPFQMISTEGKPTGISVDLAYCLGDYLKRAVVVDNIPFVGLIPALKNKKIDLIISSMTTTERRGKSIDFSDPYLTTGLCLLISRKSSVQNIEDANASGVVITVKSGTSGEVYAAAHLPKASILVLDNESSCVLEVVQGKADAFIYDQLFVYTQWQKNSDTTRALLIPFQKESWAIGVRKDNTSLLSEINQFLQEFRKQGGFEELGERYLPEQKHAFQKMGIPFVF